MGGTYGPVLVTGGAGFIGSGRVRQLERAGTEVVVLDKLTSESNLEGNLGSIYYSGRPQGPLWDFVEGDICDPASIIAADRLACERGWGPLRRIENFAAETHVDRSVTRGGGPEFFRVNGVGPSVLAEFALDRYLSGMEMLLFQMSTDEVYGPRRRPATERARLVGSSPYSASKIAGEMGVLSYRDSFGLPVLIARGSNFYGPFQGPEKLIPRMIVNAYRGLPLPIYGDGRQSREWLNLDDGLGMIDFLIKNARRVIDALDEILGKPVVNIGGGRVNRVFNRVLAKAVIDLMRARGFDVSYALLERVADRPGHDRHYKLDCSLLRKLGYTAPITSILHGGLERTIDWYLDNKAIWERLLASSDELEEVKREEFARAEKLAAK